MCQPCVSHVSARPGHVSALAYAYIQHTHTSSHIHASMHAFFECFPALTALIPCSSLVPPLRSCSPDSILSLCTSLAPAQQSSSQPCTAFTSVGRRRYKGLHLQNLDRASSTGHGATAVAAGATGHGATAVAAQLCWRHVCVCVYLCYVCMCVRVCVCVCMLLRLPLHLDRDK